MTGFPTLYWNRDGSPMSDADFVASSPKFEDRCIAHYEYRGWAVTTVWFGIDDAFGSGLPPQIFGTLMRRHPIRDRGTDDSVEVTYATEAEAVAGHILMCARLRTEVEP